METISSDLALDLLYEEADRIKMLIKNQQNQFCIFQCKAFEEVVDTQMYGLSRQVSFSIRLGIISNETGQQLLSDLERDLNQLYNQAYEENKINIEGREV
ncbi:YlaN family protein [Tetragenococcus muriaticus]|uniref:YlaN family protein n=1 Tax=Tetragenococcus muriaticus 3MR10-3 TaxID=1302648 RepID=A0A091BYU8_9ENTE|nr:YlaN family protein [Tetragenococcus muriaticus]KFN90786.1 YlaN family protein [Tetragenococcus muriaticus 3MR10-3]